MDEAELWMEFLSDTICGLCGNWGEIDTRGRATSPAGYRAGGLYWCICPNGRALKAAGAKHGVREHERVYFRKIRPTPSPDPPPPAAGPGGS